MDGSSTPRKPGRIEYFDVLRALAILAVLTIHAAITEWHRDPVGSARWDELNWINASVRWAVPIFFMISGALFLDPDRNITYRSIFTKSLPRLAVAFASWSLFFALVNVYAPGGSGSLAELATRFFEGHFHLWFLLTMMGMYLVVPLLRLISRDRAAAWYFVAVSLPFAYVLPMLTRLPGAGPVIDGVLDRTHMELVLGYSAYFLLGYLLTGVRLEQRHLWWIGGAGVVALLGTVLGTALVSRGSERWDELFYGFITPNVLVMSVAIFCLARAWGDRFRLSPRLSSAIGFFSTASFGVYLVHPFFQWVYRQFDITTSFATPWLSVPALVVMVVVPSTVVAVLVHRIPRVGKYLS